MKDAENLQSNYWIIKKRTEYALQVWGNKEGISPIGGKGSCLVEAKIVGKDSDIQQN